MDVTDVRLVHKDPNTAYISNMLWLPKSKVRAVTVQEALEYWDVAEGEAVRRSLWDETDTHLIVPREFVDPAHYPHYDFPFVDLCARRFSRTHVTDNIQWRESAQAQAWGALKVARGGILNLACGKGKSVLALKKISDLNTPALIVVNDGMQVSHWTIEIEQHLQLPPGETIGRYQSQQLDWRHPITIATIQTLARHAKEDLIPPGFGRWFGSVWFDEVHHLSAPFFVCSAPVVQGLRFGLTATATRLDEMQWIYNYHIGNIFYTDLTQDLIPTIYFQETDLVVDEKVDDVRDKRGELNISKFRSFLGQHPRSLALRYHCIKEAVDAGRKVLCIGHSKQMLQELSEMFPGSALCVSETPQEERIPLVRQSRVAFAIRKLGAECLNDAALDALFILTPFTSPNDLQQMLGRVQRPHPNKPNPVVVIFDEVNVPKLRGMGFSLKKTLRHWGMDYSKLAMPAI